MDLQENQKEIKNLMIKYFLSKIVPPIISLEKYIKFIEVYAKKENLKDIKKALLLSKREIYTARLVTRNFEFLVNSFNKKIKIEIEPIQIEHVIQKLLYKFYSIYPTKKAELSIKGKNHIINSDKKLFYLMIENFIYYIFSHAKSLVKVSIKQNKKCVVITIEQDGEDFEDFKVDNLNIQSYFEKNLPLEMYISQKILNIFNYSLEVKEKTIELTLSLMPPKKYL
jgi:K+-sensing histidine kinase KdpD